MQVGRRQSTEARLEAESEPVAINWRKKAFSSFDAHPFGHLCSLQRTNNENKREIDKTIVGVMRRVTLDEICDR